MERNLVSDSELTNKIANAGLNILLINKLLSQNELVNLQLQFGYLFETDSAEIEGLFRIVSGNKHFFMALQKGKIMLLNYTEELFNSTIKKMQECHPCLQENGLNENIEQKNRREKNNKFISEQNICVNNSLVSKWMESRVFPKNAAAIAPRALSCLFTIQIACSIPKGEYEKARAALLPIIEKFGLINFLLGKERRIVYGQYSQQDAIDMDWAYETYWALCWCVGLVDDITDAGTVCDCQQAISFTADCTSVDDFAAKCHMREKSELIDMLDLYYRYHWAVYEKRCNINANIGNLNPSIVIERRRGLEWVMSNTYDWYDINL